MTRPTLVSARLSEGVWTARLLSETAPALTARLPGGPVAPPEVVRAGDGWEARLAIPKEAVTDGVQVVLVLSGEEVLATIPVAAGEALAEDTRAELAALRAELELLKRAFRQHCAEP